MRLNSKMSALMEKADIPIPFSNGLTVAQLESPVFESIGGSVLLKSEFEKNRHVKVSDFSDRTGFECFINHVHLPFTSTRDSLLRCLSYAITLGKGLARLEGRRYFHVIVAIAGDGCTIRFHEVRLGEKWIADNLEGYTDEAILVLDVESGRVARAL